MEAQSDSYPLWTAHEYPSQDAHDVRPCPACPGSVHAHAARAYCHVACTPTSHDDACAWFGTDEPRPARLPGLIDPSGNGSRTPCSRCGVPLRYVENLLTVCLRCEPLSDHEPVIRAQCWAKPPHPYQQQLCQMTKSHAGPHQTYDGVIWPSDPSGNDSSQPTGASDRKGSS